MSFKGLAVSFVIYTILVFLLDMAFIRPGKGMPEHILFAVVAGTFFLLFMILFRWLMIRKAAARDKDQ
jgi:hypothetical protein